MCIPVVRCKPLLGTLVEVMVSSTVKDEASEEELRHWSDRAFSEIERLQNRLSFHRVESELSLFNRWAMKGGQGYFQVSEELGSILKLALELSKATEGRYDICVAPALVEMGQLPAFCSLALGNAGRSEHMNLAANRVTIERPLCIDLGGIAKGYAVDCALALMPENLSVSVNAGGDVRMSHWHRAPIVVRYGRASWQNKLFTMKAPALASSGSYYRNAIVNSKNGKPIKRRGSLSVHASTALLADALTKVVWVSSREQALAVLQCFDAQALLVNGFGRVRVLNPGA